ncbi:MAG: transaldolase [Chloroflexi bacterium]|nr:transaldolase [Chloroflexota bacterium]
MVAANRLLGVNKLGQSVWLDFISRDIISSGELKKLIEEDGISGVTTNPTIFEKAISAGQVYNEAIQRLATQGKSAEEVYDVLTSEDVAGAADLLRGVHKSSQGIDGYVSIETWPKYAHDVVKTVDYARRIARMVGRENILIKVPATKEGPAAIERLIAEGINVNVTLIFSLRHYESVAQAYIRGLKAREKKGADLKSVVSVASVFVSRIDTAVDKLLDAMLKETSDPAMQKDIRSLRGKAAVANSKIVYQHFKEIFASSDVKALQKKGARLQRVLWGSTGTKDPTYSDVKYMEELIGPDTVNTLPPATISAFKDHGVARSTLTEEVEEAHRVLDRLSGLGIDVDAVCQKVQDEGVKAFADSFDALISSIEAKRKNLAKVV